MSEPNQPGERRRDDKEEKRNNKRSERWQYKIDRIKALTAKALAVAKKRKWLVFLIGAGIAAYYFITSGSMGGAIDIIKSFL